MKFVQVEEIREWAQEFLIAREVLFSLKNAIFIVACSILYWRMILLFEQF